MKLRKLEGKDAKFMLEWMHDDFVVHDLRTNFADFTLNDCMNFISLAQDTSDNLHLAIVDDNDEYMGTVSLKNIRDKSAEFAITIRKCAMGKGYSQYGMKEIIEYGKKILGLNTIYWCVSPNNHRAVKFYNKSNYRIINAPVQAQLYTEKEKSEFIWYEA